MIETPDIILRTIAVSAAMFLAALMLMSRKPNRSAFPGSLFALAIAAFWVTSVPGMVSGAGFWAAPLVAICITKTVWFWLFARSLFNESARIESRHAAMVVGIAMAGVWQQLVFVDRYRAGVSGGLENIFGLGLDGLLAGFVFMGLFEAWRGLGVDLVEKRRKLRLCFMMATGAYLAIAMGVQAWNLFNEVETALLVTRANMLLVSVVFLLAGGLLLQPRKESWLDPGRVAPAVALSRVEQAVLQQLERMLEHDRVHMQENLTIAGLAAQLRTGEHILRRVINQGMGHRNFNDFLHSWRIREACEELARPEQAKIPVLTIAMRVGYGSIGAFNRAFKARVGMTPTAFRRARLHGALPAQ